MQKDWVLEYNRDMDYYFIQERDGSQDSGFLYKIYSEDEDDRTLLETTGWYDDAEALVSRYRTEDVMRNRELTGINHPDNNIVISHNAVDRSNGTINLGDGGWSNIATSSGTEDLSNKVDALSDKMDKIIRMLDSGLTSGEIDVLDEDLQLGSKTD